MQVQHDRPSYGYMSRAPYISDNELNILMESDIIKHVVQIGFPLDKVQNALRQKIEKSGEPFYGIESCIESVLQYMEEEARNTLSERVTREAEIHSNDDIQLSQTERRESTNEQIVVEINTNEQVETIYGRPIRVLSTIEEEEQQSPNEMTTQTAAVSSTGTSEATNEQTAVEDRSLCYQQLQEELNNLEETQLCKICMDAVIEVVFLPCQHMVTCSQCAALMTKCPICMGIIKYFIKPIIS